MPIITGDETTELQTAQIALGLWSGACQDVLVPFGTSASSVFGVRVSGTTHFLRLTDRSFRSLEDATDEMSFLAHLHAHSVQVAMPIPSIRGRTVEMVGGHLATLFRRAPGIRVTPEHVYWNEALFREWGRALARQHKAARTFLNPSFRWRQDWRREPVLVDSLARIQATDNELAQIADSLFAELEAHTGVLGEVGTIHADIGPQNFRYKPRCGITPFDFDNCCRPPTEAVLEGKMVQGQCLCGKVRFEVSGDLGSTRLCYCELCRRANGSAFSANVRVPASSYRLLSGADVIREYESSPGAFRAFCSICGSPVYARVISDPDYARVRLGTLDTDANAIVAAHVWVRSKPHWYEIADDLPQYEQATPRK